MPSLLMPSVLMPAIRPAQAADLPAILSIYNDAILHTTAVYEYAPHTLAMRSEWFAAKQAGGYPVLVATIADAPASVAPASVAPASDATGADTVVGFGAFGSFRAGAAYQYTVENSVYVADGWRRQGIGRRLLLALIEEARRQGKHTLVGVIDADNQPSLHLHASCGFVEAAHFHQVGYKFDRWLDLKFLQLVLDNSHLA